MDAGDRDGGPGDGDDAGPAGGEDAGPAETDAGPEATDAGPGEVDAGPGDADAGPGGRDAGPGTCGPDTDPSSIGVDCSGGRSCPECYTCEDFVGFVLSQTCEILCGAASDCPRGLDCVTVTDKARTWKQCGSP